MTYKNYKQKVKWLVVGLLFIAMVIAPVTQATTVVNNVVVESSSNSDNNPSSTISVKTVVNGKVVENYQETSATGKLLYSSQINGDNFERIIVASSSHSSVNDSSTRLNELMSLLKELLQLMIKLSGGK